MSCLYRILKKLKLAEKVYQMDIVAPRIANAAKPGQFIILMISENGERIPLTIVDYNMNNGTVTIVFQVSGKSTELLAYKQENEYIAHLTGPLGQPSELINKSVIQIKKNNILFIAGGVGAAPVYPQIKWLKNNGIEADIILGSKSRDYVILKDELQQVSRNVYICTDDGSLGYKGFVTDRLKEILEYKAYNYIVTVGPLVMMRAVSNITKAHNIKTIVSLNSIMIDGTGMCGACRVTVNNEIKFTCVDGPEFDGHKVDFEEAIIRQRMFNAEESKGFKIKDCNCGRRI